MPFLVRQSWQRLLNRLPKQGFFFDRPLVLIQSDDWGRVGLRDREGLELLREAGLKLGERPYDFYTLETANDLTALSEMLKRHRDSAGRSAVIGMNFLTANLDFSRMASCDFREIQLLALCDGLPRGWQRPGLIQAYKHGIETGVFYPALHGTTHFCRSAVERHLADSGERGTLLRQLWKAGTPYVHWRMPWIGYEYWDPEQPMDDRFLPYEAQLELIGWAVGRFAKLFGAAPQSACAPGYRADEATNRAWAKFGIRVAQRGPDSVMPPHLHHGGILQLHRSIDFEPAVKADFSVDSCLRKADECLSRRIPLILSIHSINFHSSIRDHRGRTLEMLDTFLSVLEARYADLLYLHDRDLYDLVHFGTYESREGRVHVGVTKQTFTRSTVGKH